MYCAFFLKLEVENFLKYFTKIALMISIQLKCQCQGKLKMSKSLHDWEKSSGYYLVILSKDRHTHKGTFK